MAHIHPEGIDFVVSCFIVHQDSCFLIHHKKLGGWFPVGGHVELNEDPDAAMEREILEEFGYPVQFINPPGAWPPLPPVLQFDPTTHNTRSLRRPWAVEIHDFPPQRGHRHVALVYLALADSFDFRLEDSAHHAGLWIMPASLEGVAGALPTVRWYVRQAVKAASEYHNATPAR